MGRALGTDQIKLLSLRLKSQPRSTELAAHAPRDLANAIPGAESNVTEPQFRRVRRVGET